VQLAVTATERPEWFDWDAHDFLVDAASRWAAELSPAERQWYARIPNACLPDDPVADEQGTLGALLRQPALHARTTLTAQSFSEPLHARIFATARALWQMGRSAGEEAVADVLAYALPGPNDAGYAAADPSKLTPLELFIAERWSVPGYVLSLVDR
jgi:hypothetical protein